MMLFLKKSLLDNHLVISVILFLTTALLLSFNLNKPFIGEHDWNGARYGNIARNYVRYGYFETKFGQVENSGFVKRQEFEYFTHYPPLLPLMISISYKLFGVGEWPARLITLLATSGTVVLIFLIGRKLYDFATGLCSALLVLVTPQVLYFGKNPVHEPLVVFFVLLSYFGFIKKKKAIFYFGLILAEFTTWAGYFLVPALTITLILKKDLNGLKKLTPAWIISFLVFTLHITHTYFLTGNFFGGDILGVFFQRAALSSVGQIDNLTPLTYINQIRLWMTSLYSLPLVAISLIGVISLIRDAYRTSLKDNSLMVLVLGVFGSTYLVLFPNSSFIHNYITFYLLPFIALSAGVVLVRMGEIGGIREIRGLKYLMILAAVIIIFIERFGYLKALDSSNADRLGWEAGLALKNLTKPEDIVFITPKIFYYRSENFVKFYSDRKLVFEDKKESSDATLVVDQDNGRFDILKQ